MTIKEQVHEIIANAEKAISQLTECDTKLTLFLTVNTSQQHELVIAACEIWQVDVAGIAVRDRHQHNVVRRQLLAWLLREKTLLSLRKIAAYVGYAGHYDVSHGIGKAQANVSVNDELTLHYYNPIKHLFTDEAV